MHAKDVSGDSLRLFRNCVVFTLLFGLAAHAYCYFNLTLSHDALFSLYRQDMAMQVQLGRFMHVPYLALRGNITAPALVGFLALAFLCCSTYLTARLLGIRSTLLVALMCGVLATNIAFTLTNASYLHESDMYMLALLLACGAVWCCRTWKHGWLLGALLVAVSLGFYQAYLSVALMLFIMIAIGRVLDGASAKQVLAEMLPMLGTVGLGFLLYLAALFATTNLTGYGFSSDYNGLANVGDYSDVSIPALIAKTWLYPVRYLAAPEGMYPQLVGVLNIVLSAATLVTLVWLAYRGRVFAGSVVIMVVLLLLMPFAANYVYFVSKGMVHGLMIYAFFYWYVFAIQLQQRVVDEPGRRRGGAFSASPRPPVFLTAVVCAVCALSVLFGIVFANQAYFKKQLQFESTELTMNRVIDRLEQVEGYVPGETPVYLAGSLYESPLFKERIGFEDVTGTGFYRQTAITYDEACYFSMVLGYPINLVPDSQAKDMVDMKEVEAMGVFPASTSADLVDGVAVVRLSEDLSGEEEG